MNAASPMSDPAAAALPPLSRRAAGRDPRERARGGRRGNEDGRPRRLRRRPSTPTRIRHPAPSSTCGRAPGLRELASSRRRQNRQATKATMPSATSTSTPQARTADGPATACPPQRAATRPSPRRYRRRRSRSGTPPVHMADPGQHGGGDAQQGDEAGDEDRLGRPPKKPGGRQHLRVAPGTTSGSGASPAEARPR